jgi:hypothetical protein
MATTTNISANDMLSSYALFNATDIKQFIIDQLKTGNSVFKDADYLGSNINAFIDIIAVMLQQILFSYSVNASETSFSTAMLYENMSKIVSILNYKAAGKQTSILPVKITINRPAGHEEVSDVVLPRFLTANHNYQYVLPEDEIIHLNGNSTVVDTVMFQGAVHQSSMFTAVGDEFETIYLDDNYINSSSSFISDNFFTVFVDENGDGNWKRYEETATMFLETSIAEKYEKRFTEDSGYEFKFGNGTYGKKLPEGAKIIIYYLISNGEVGIVGSNIFTTNKISLYASSEYNGISSAVADARTTTIVPFEWLTIQNSGPSTAISYPETVESIRKNAHKVFASQGRMFSLADYETYIRKNFTSYIKDIYIDKNDFYTSEYLKYFYDLGIASPQKDSRVSIAQVEFMNANNFNNIYCFLVPAINTIINGKVPNYLNTSLKRQIVNKCKPQMGPCHNLVIVDPVYRAFTFGSDKLDDDSWNENQLLTKLVLVKNKHSKYSSSYVKSYCVETLKAYFNSLKLGSTINPSIISQLILDSPGIKGYYLQDTNGNVDGKITLFTWNPLYKNEDRNILTQASASREFEYPYFYDINNLSSIVTIVEES